MKLERWNWLFINMFETIKSRWRWQLNNFINFIKKIGYWIIKRKILSQAWAMWHCVFRMVVGIKVLEPPRSIFLLFLLVAVPVGFACVSNLSILEPLIAQARKQWLLSYNQINKNDVKLCITSWVVVVFFLIFSLSFFHCNFHFQLCVNKENFYND